VPARRVGWMCRCGERLHMINGAARCDRCGSRYEEKEGGRLIPIDSPPGTR
jgi:hypothetical protein